MKFKTNRDHLATGLAQVLSVVGSKATMPILSNVLIEASDGHLWLTTTNLDLGIRCCIKADIKEAGAITLPVRRLASIVRELPNVDVTIDVSASFQAKLSSGGSTFRLMGIGKEEFPPLPSLVDEKSLTLSQADLAAMINSVSYAQSSDETRYTLNGVYFNVGGGGLSLVATDGRRLAVARKGLELPESSDGAIIIPARTIGEIGRLLGKGEKVKINFGERRCSFEIANDTEKEGLVDSVYLYSKIVDGNYPNYKQVIPKEGGYQRVTLERELFLECVHRASLVCSEKSNSVKLKLTANQLEITAQSPDFGEAHETISISYSGPDMSVGFNPAFVMDPMKALNKDEVFLEVKDEVSPGVFKTTDDFTCVIMPMRQN